MSKKLIITENQLKTIIERKHSYRDNSPEGDMEEGEIMGAESAIVKPEEDMEESDKSMESPDIISFTIPTYAASVLINGDSSGLEDNEEEEINDFVDEITSKFGNANFMLPNEDEMDLGFCYRNDINNLGGECYKLLLRPSKKDVESPESKKDIPGFEGTSDDLDSLSIRESIKANFKRFL